MQKASRQLRVGTCGLSDCLLSNNRYRKCDYSRNQIFACMKTGLAINSIAKTQSHGSRVRGFAGESWRRVPISLSWLMSHQSAGSHPSMAQMSAGSPRGCAVEADNVSHHSRLPGLIEPKRGGVAQTQPVSITQQDVRQTEAVVAGAPLGLQQISWHISQKVISVL